MEKKKKKRTVYEVLREETVHYMDTLFKWVNIDLKHVYSSDELLLKMY